MTIKTSVHSNAFNFMSFMQGGVDPRTGQYTVSLSLPDVKTNDLQGPGLPLSLGFNPLNSVDSGYGRGWNLQLSQYDISKNIISLSTGETFARSSQDAEGPDGRARMWFGEQKLDTFHCYAVTAVGGGKHYWVMHKSGLKEVLAPQAGGVALPIEIHAPSGHKVTLSYNTFATNESILNEVKDAAGITLLKVKRDTALNQVHIDLGPGGANTVRFMMQLEPNTALVKKVVLPTTDNACWWFDYGAEKNGYAIIREARTPVGGRETILYEDDGHAFPDGSGVKPRNPPRVTTHITDTGTGLAHVKVGYTYANAGPITRSNFLGAGVNIPYTGDGMDNLYKYNGEYHYETVETLYEGVAPGAPVVRTVRRRFNKFHLLISETTHQGSNIHTVATAYNLLPVQFPDQPKNCQLPKSVSTTWDIRETGMSRTETVLYEHDPAGNMTKQTEPTGVVETSTWYDATCGTGCPTDPEGFTRYLKEKKVTPGPSENPGAPELVTAYTYTKLPPVAGSPMNDWWAPNTETLTEGNQVLQETQYTLLNIPNDAFKHGRMAETVVTMNGKDTKTTYAYAKIKNGTVLETTETLTGFDHQDPSAPSEDRRHVQKAITLEHSLLNGEPLLNHDDNDVEIRYTYDVLRRVTSETVAPADENTDPEENYEATRAYTYTLCDASLPAGQRTQAKQTLEDVNGVHTATHFDGLNRAIEEWRDDADAAAGNNTKALRQTYTAHYDVSGNLVDETEFDWMGAVPMPLKSTYEYDDWGAQKCVIGPDRVKVYEETIPVGTAEHPDGPVQRSWSQQGTQKTGVTETWLNHFEKPVMIQRFNLNNERISRHDYEYDGLGRTAKEITGIDGVRRTTSFVYDAFDRLLENTLPLGARVTRTFAPHSSEDLPTKISVDTKVLGEQTFDGLGRMIQSITGGRTKTFSYAPGFSKPESVVTPSGHMIEYTYIPQLGEEPVSRSLKEEEGGSPFAIDNLAFGYDPKNARLLTCKVDNVELLKREYFSTGEVSQETGIVAGEPYEMKYLYSRLGRLQRYTDVLSQEQRYEYDFAGRLSNTRLESTTSAFTYDELGRPHTVLTSDSGQSLKVTLAYDEFGRETERKFEFGTTTQTLTQQYDDVDCLTERKLVQGEAPSAEVLRLEKYTYDFRGRLSGYTCEGTELPVDSAGTVISSQAFTFDGLDNIMTLRTNVGLADDNFAIYGYGQGTQDPAQLQSISNISENPAYPDRSFTYDADGNLTKDEEERTLAYDALGRLTAVLDGANEANYQYDPLDKLTVHSAGASQDKLFYRDGVLANQVGSTQSSTFVRGGDHLLAEQRSEGALAQSDKTFRGVR
jgi:YD repeat-containing protein